MTVLSQLQADYIQLVQATVNSCYPPYAEGFVSTTQKTIEDLVKTNPFPFNETVDSCLQQAGKNSKLLGGTVSVQSIQQIINDLMKIIEENLKEFRLEPPQGITLTQPRITRPGQHQLNFEPYLFDLINVAIKRRIPLDHARIEGRGRLLYVALELGCTKAVRDLIARGVNVNARFPDVPPAIFDLGKKHIGNLSSKLTKIVLTANPNVMIRDVDGRLLIIKHFEKLNYIKDFCFQLVLESVKDINLAFADRRSLDALWHSLLKFGYRNIWIGQDYAKLFIYHGLKFPEIPNEGVAEGARETFGEAMPFAYKLYQTTSDEIRKPLEQIKQDIQSASQFYPSLIRVVLDYLHDEREIRIKIARLCFCRDQTFAPCIEEEAELKKLAEEHPYVEKDVKEQAESNVPVVKIKVRRRVRSGRTTQTQTLTRGGIWGNDWTKDEE